MNETKENMNLYIINKVLWDYTDGMVVIAAKTLGFAREMYSEAFDEPIADFDDAITKGSYKVIKDVNYPEGIVSYVKGGG